MRYFLRPAHERRKHNDQLYFSTKHQTPLLEHPEAQRSQRFTLQALQAAIAATDSAAPSVFDPAAQLSAHVVLLSLYYASKPVTVVGFRPATRQTPTTSSGEVQSNHSPKAS